MANANQNYRNIAVANGIKGKNYMGGMGFKRQLKKDTSTETKNPNIMTLSTIQIMLRKYSTMSSEGLHYLICTECLNFLLKFNIWKWN